MNASGSCNKKNNAYMIDRKYNTSYMIYHVTNLESRLEEVVFKIFYKSNLF